MRKYRGPFFFNLFRKKTFEEFVKDGKQIIDQHDIKKVCSTTDLKIENIAKLRVDYIIKLKTEESALTESRQFKNEREELSNKIHNEVCGSKLTYPDEYLERMRHRPFFLLNTYRCLVAILQMPAIQKIIRDLPAKKREQQPKKGEQDLTQKQRFLNNLRDYLIDQDDIKLATTLQNKEKPLWEEQYPDLDPIRDLYHTRPFYPSIEYDSFHY